MARKRTQFSNSMDTDLMNKLRDVSDETDIPISKLLDRAVRLLLEQFEKDEESKK